MNLVELLTQNTLLLALSTAQMAGPSTLPWGGLSFPVCRMDLRGEWEQADLAAPSSQGCGEKDGTEETAHAGACMT